MGTSAPQKSSLLAKNWVRLDNNTYRNAITEQLIDEHFLDSPSEQAMQAAHGRLLSRANINHPNVIKLIYFCQEAQKDCCNNNSFRHRVFIEHQHQQLAHYLAIFKDTPKNGEGRECFCCAIANAFAYLSEKYGYFVVKDSMVFLVSQMKWHRNHDRKTVKVWANSNLQECRPEESANQEDMCRSMRSIYDKIATSGVCSKIRSIMHSQTNKWQFFLEEVYRLHDNVYQPVQDRKRVLSTYNSSNPTFFRSNPAHESSQDSLGQIKTNRVPPVYKEADNTARNVIITTNESQSKKDEIGTTKKIVPSPISRKLLLGESGLKQVHISPFYRPPNVSKVNFAYQDQFTTPKQHKVTHAVNSTSPFPIVRPNLQPVVNLPAFISTEQREQTVEQKQVQKIEIKSRQSVKQPSLQRMTVNIMVECQLSPKETVQIIPQSSQQSLTNKLAEILQSEQHIPSSPFLIDVNQPQSVPRVIEERCAQSINESNYKQDDSEEAQEEQILHYEYEDEAPQINIEASGQPETQAFTEPHIPLSRSIRESQKSDQQQKITYFKEPVPSHYFTSFEKETAYEGNEETEVHAVPNFGSINGPPVLMHTSKHGKFSKRSLEDSHPYQQPFHSAAHSEYSRLDTNYDKYLHKFNQAMKPSSPRSKFSSQKQAFESMPSHSGHYLVRKKQSQPFPLKLYNNYNSLNLQESSSRRKSRSRGNQLEMSGGNPPKNVQSGELESLYNQSANSEQEKKARIIERIENTQKIIRENRKKLEKIELEKDLQREKEIIKKEMDSLLKNNLMSDQSNRIKEKVKYKKATFAELKAQASKILQDLNF